MCLRERSLPVGHTDKNIRYIVSNPRGKEKEKLC
nr:MAG TPA: hypothetical protein [Caudoviricetes sp.]